MLLDSKKYGNLRCLINSDIERSSWQHNSNYESFDSSNVHPKGLIGQLSDNMTQWAGAQIAENCY